MARMERRRERDGEVALRKKTYMRVLEVVGGRDGWAGLAWGAPSEL